ncbi:heparin lyase I family protein [Streptomyces sp. NPDC057136]|uniref:heparin lyase I family protein n=1 Tax=Streptomyces sp. NPDC057136 TaxID=3346029 RepID=UPI003637DC62
MRKRLLALPAAILAWSVIVASPASASLTWDGDTTNGIGVFGSLECPSPGGIVSAAQTDGHGDIWRYTKAVGIDRCESKGIRIGGSNYTFQNNSTYYLGWESKLSTTSLASGDFVVFQWKSYPNSSQNYPVLMTVSGGSANLYYIEPGEVWNKIWSAPIAAFDWHRFAFAIHTSDSTTGGWIELRLDGAQQTFINGSTRYTGRTWDTYNDPKWGAYDRDHPENEIINRIDSLKLGTSYADVD